MEGFELRTSRVGGDRCVNYATAGETSSKLKGSDESISIQKLRLKH